MTGPYDHDRAMLEKLRGMTVDDGHEGNILLPQYAGAVYVSPGMVDDICNMKMFWKPATITQEGEYALFIGYVNNGDGRVISIYRMI